MLFRSNDTATTEIYTLRYTLSLHDALPIAAALFELDDTPGAVRDRVVALDAEWRGRVGRMSGLLARVPGDEEETPTRGQKQ